MSLCIINMGHPHLVRNAKYCSRVTLEGIKIHPEIWGAIECWVMNSTVLGDTPCMLSYTVYLIYSPLGYDAKWDAWYAHMDTPKQASYIAIGIGVNRVGLPE